MYFHTAFWHVQKWSNHTTQYSGSKNFKRDFKLSYKGIKSSLDIPTKRTNKHPIYAPHVTIWFFESSDNFWWSSNNFWHIIQVQSSDNFWQSSDNFWHMYMWLQLSHSQNIPLLPQVIQNIWIGTLATIPNYLIHLICFMWFQHCHSQNPSPPPQVIQNI